MGCGASIDAGQVDRKALAPSLVVTLHDHQPTRTSQKDEPRRSSKNDGPRRGSQSRGDSRRNWKRDASKDGERFGKGEVTVVLLLGATNFTLEHSEEWAHVAEELGFCRLGMGKILQEKTEKENGAVKKEARNGADDREPETREAEKGAESGSGKAEMESSAVNRKVEIGAEKLEAEQGEGEKGAVNGADDKEAESKTVPKVANGTGKEETENRAEKNELGNGAEDGAGKQEAKVELNENVMDGTREKTEVEILGAPDDGKGATENGGAEIIRAAPLSLHGDSGSFDQAFRGLLGAIRRIAGRRLLIDGTTWTVREVEAFEAIVAPIDLVLLFDCAQDTSLEPKAELPGADVSSPPDSHVESLGTAAGRQPGDESASSEGDVSVTPETQTASLKADVIGQPERSVATLEADVSSQPVVSNTTSAAAAAAADRFGPLRDYFKERVSGGKSDVIVHVVSSGSASADDVAKVLHEQEYRFVPLEAVARVDSNKRLAEEDKRWAALMAANPSGPIATASPEDTESAAEKFRKEYPWVVPLKYVASFCVRLTERYWAWFDPEPVEAESDSEDEGGTTDADSDAQRNYKTL
ncbi:hypothetical protein KFL_000840160 [Klebsormidium nitens]|uniref:Uncharacterized protein n=1 Tax=Klebsormidium nitens TaxID=105231 RepID=A0A1Y1HSF9_KLENI|nr:hypothetical protein KFL_000840160 [Klebsormidium nitens]|eukprot:GAQ81574.1 hypothetical protein KFL_000840160 [Klebsormidium nitens]